MTLQKTKPTYKTLTKLMFTNGNIKTDKNKHIEGLEDYLIKRLNFAPAKISGYEVCASKSKGCEGACLHESGNPVHMPQKTLGRVNRTLFYFKERAKFLSMMTREIRNHEINCKKKNLKPVVRLTQLVILCGKTTKYLIYSQTCNFTTTQSILKE